MANITDRGEAFVETVPQERTRLDWKSWEDFPPPRRPIGAAILSGVFLVIGLVLAALAAWTVVMHVVRSVDEGRITAGLSALIAVLAIIVYIFVGKNLLDGQPWARWAGVGLAALFAAITAMGLLSGQVEFPSVLGVLAAIVLLLSAWVIFYLLFPSTGEYFKPTLVRTTPLAISLASTMFFIYAVLVIGLFFASVIRIETPAGAETQTTEPAPAVDPFGAAPAAQPESTPVTRTDFDFSLPALLALAGAFLASGIGLWRLKNWGRTLGVALLVLATLGGIVYILIEKAYPQAVFLLIPIAGIIYLLWPSVVFEYDKAEVW